MGSYLGKAAILRAEDRPKEEVVVPEWADPETGADRVLVRGLDGKGRDEYFASMAVQRDPRKPPVVDSENATAKLIARCVVDEDGNLLFTQSDVHALGEKSGAALDRVSTVAMRLSGLSDEDMAELGKDSPSTPSGGSTSGSPPSSGARSKSSSSR